MEDEKIIGSNAITIFLNAIKDKLTFLSKKSETVSDLSYDATNKKITKTIDGSTSDVVYTSVLKTDMEFTKSDIGLENVTNDSQVKRIEMGVANGVATLDLNGKVPSSQLPSYVDDIIDLLNVTDTAPSTCVYGDRYYNTSSNKIFTAVADNTWGSIGETPESGKIYVNTNDNITYRWSGSVLVVISAALALGETSNTAYRGDRGKVAYEHSQSTHARTDATKTENSSINGNIKINGTETNVYTHPSTSAVDATPVKVGKDSSGHVVIGTTLVPSDIDAATSSHVHGNIQNNGTLQNNDVTIANGDKLVITDNSDGDKITRTSTAFDGSTTTKALTQKGTFETFIQNHQDISGKANVSDVYQKSQTYSKSEVNALITTPNQEYVTVSSTPQTTSVTEVLPLSGSTDTIYRVGNWNGSQYDTSVYSEYAWNGSVYIPLSIKPVQSGLPIVLQSSSTALIEPNKINYWETPINSLEIAFSPGVSGYGNEYIIDFTCPSNVATNLTLPEGIVWANDDDLYPEEGMRYQISILDGLAVYAEWEAAQND